MLGHKIYLALFKCRVLACSSGGRATAGVKHSTVLLCQHCAEFVLSFTFNIFPPYHINSTVCSCAATTLPAVSHWPIQQNCCCMPQSPTSAAAATSVNTICVLPPYHNCDMCNNSQNNSQAIANIVWYAKQQQKHVHRRGLHQLNRSSHLPHRRHNTVMHRAVVHISSRGLNPWVDSRLKCCFQHR